VVADSTRIILLPLIAPHDERANRIKSGHLVLYLAQHVAVPRHPLLSALPIENFSSLDGLESRRNRTKTLLIFLDDFIGSGDTAESGLRYYEENYKVPDDRIVIVCLVTMRHAMDRLTGGGYSVYCAQRTDKGITENPNLLDKPHALALIDSIEAELSIGSIYRRGYKASESLVSMIRTPDNTFPMFWCLKKLDGSAWPAPFART
jgi:hypothetical protein